MVVFINSFGNIVKVMVYNKQVVDNNLLCLNGCDLINVVLLSGMVLMNVMGNIGVNIVVGVGNLQYNGLVIVMVRVVN